MSLLRYIETGRVSLRIACPMRNLIALLDESEPGRQLTAVLKSLDSLKAEVYVEDKQIAFHLTRSDARTPYRGEFEGRTYSFFPNGGEQAFQVIQIRSPQPVSAVMRRVSAGMRRNGISPLEAGGLGFLALMTLMAAMFFVYALFTPYGTPTPIAWEWRAPIVEPAEPIGQRSAPADMHTLSRPLFAKTRRPKPVKAVEIAVLETPKRAPEVTGLSVSGIIHFSQNSAAYILNQNAGGEWYHVGETVAGWKVQSIRRLDLTLKNGEQTAILELYPAGAPSAVHTRPPAQNSPSVPIPIPAPELLQERRGPHRT